MGSKHGDQVTQEWVSGRRAAGRCWLGLRVGGWPFSLPHTHATTSPTGVQALVAEEPSAMASELLDSYRAARVDGRTAGWELKVGAPLCPASRSWSTWACLLARLRQPPCWSASGL